jgi:hypothetical protein
MTKYQIKWLQNRRISTILEVGKHAIKVLTDSLSDEGSLLVHR